MKELFLFGERILFIGTGGADAPDEMFADKLGLEALRGDFGDKTSLLFGLLLMLLSGSDAIAVEFALNGSLGPFLGVPDPDADKSVNECEGEDTLVASFVLLLLLLLLLPPRGVIGGRSLFLLLLLDCLLSLSSSQNE